MTARSAGFTLILLWLLLAPAPPASGVLIDSGDGTGNTSAPSPDPGFINPMLTRRFPGPRTNSFDLSKCGVSGPPKWMIGAVSGFEDQKVPNQPAYMGNWPSTLSDNP